MRKPKKKLLSAVIIFLAASSILLPAGAFADSCNNSAPSAVQQCLKGNPIVADLNTIINFLSAGVGIVVVGTIILGGIQYGLAGDSADAVGKAKQRVINGVIALVAFMFMFAFLQWLIPGGIFG